VTLTYTTTSARGTAILRGLTLIGLGALMVACATPAPVPSRAPMPAPDTIVLTEQQQTQNLLVEAETTLELAAVRRALDAVLGLEAPGEGFLWRAEQLWSVLPGAGREHLDDRYRGARIAVLQGDSQRALDRLQPMNAVRDADRHRAAVALYAELLGTSGAWNEALSARIQLDQSLLDDPDQQTANQKAIWDLLATVGSGQLTRLYRQHDDPLLEGWAALFIALRAAGPTPEAFDEAVQTWGEAYPRHPAHTRLRGLRQHALQSPAPAQRIAVLLPLSGEFGDLGNAILEGITAQYYDNANPSGSLRVFDTGGDPNRAEAQYYDALRQGADRVIGPLTRLAVDRVAALESQVPTLLLNQPRGPLSAPFFALSLSPEDDARAVAREAGAADWHRILVLVPEGAFGERVVTAFGEALRWQEGRIAATYRYQAQSSELNAQVGTALGVDDSAARIRQLTRQSGLALEGDPQIRADIDMIFVVGSARDLRLLVPHLHYHRAGGLPMLATSHAYEGRPQPRLDQDLRGIRFPDAPWLYPELNPAPELKASLSGGGSDTASNRLPRFAALGIDAVQIALELPHFEHAPQRTATGVTGTLGLQPLTRTWARDPAWLEFRDGAPVPTQPRVQRLASE